MFFVFDVFKRVCFCNGTAHINCEYLYKLI